MPKYSYTARLAGGETVSSTADAADLPELAAKLAAQGATIQGARIERKLLPRIRGIPYFEITAIYRQVSSAIEAGMPLAETLEMLSGESRNPKLKSLLYFLKSRVAEGAPLSEAMSDFPDAFPEVHVAVVRAGEESGWLERTLADLADQAESFSNMNRRFASALVYPTVIAVAALALLNFGWLAIVPKFKYLFGDLGITDFSTVSRIAFFIGGWLMPITMLILVAVAILAVLIFAQRRAASGRLWLDAWKLRLPVVGQIIEKASLARFSGTLGLLLSSGIDLPRAVRLAAEGAGNRTVERLLQGVSAQIERGRSLSEAVGDSGAMPASMSWRVGVAEESGMLPESLVSMSGLYAAQVDSLVASLAGLLEPVLIIVIGTGIALLVLGMFLPLTAVIQSLCGYSG